MIKPEQIPKEAVQAFFQKLWASKMNNADHVTAIAAALNAWPGMEPHKLLEVRHNGEGYDLRLAGIILPLTEQNDDKA